MKFGWANFSNILKDIDIDIDSDIDKEAVKELINEALVEVDERLDEVEKASQEKVLVVKELPEIGDPNIIYIVDEEGHDTSYHWNAETGKYETLVGSAIASDDEGNPITMVAASEDEIEDLLDDLIIS